MSFRSSFDKLRTNGLVTLPSAEISPLHRRGTNRVIRVGVCGDDGMGARRRGEVKPHAGRRPPWLNPRQSPQSNAERGTRSAERPRPEVLNLSPYDGAPNGSAFHALRALVACQRVGLWLFDRCGQGVFEADRRVCFPGVFEF